MPRLHTFFNAMLLQGSLALMTSGATLTGHVQIVSPATHSHALSDVVAWLDPLSSPPVPSQPEHARLLQKEKTFRPHVLIVRTGTIVDFPNEDPIFHNAFSTYEGQLFDVGLYPPGTSRSVRFRRPGVVRVFCNIHPSMSAVIIVVNTDYFGTVSAGGEYRFSGVSPGSYRVNVYDERASEGQHNQTQITVPEAAKDVAAPPIRLSEAGFVRASHKNKFGRDYPPDSDNRSYDGIMK